jgi:hypothetical protein
VHETWILAQDDRSMVVAEKLSWPCLLVANFREEGPEPRQVLPGVREPNVLGLGRRQCDHVLTLSRPPKRTSP